MKKKTKKQTKTTSKKATKKITKSASKILTKKASIIEDLEPIQMQMQIQKSGSESINEKISWDIVNEAFSLFSDAFQPDGFEDEEGNYIVNDKFIAVWKNFLLISGWTEDEFWDYTHDAGGECPECKKEKEEQEKIEKLKNSN